MIIYYFTNIYHPLISSSPHSPIYEWGAEQQVSQTTVYILKEHPKMYYFCMLVCIVEHKYSPIRNGTMTMHHTTVSHCTLWHGSSRLWQGSQPLHAHLCKSPDILHMCLHVCICTYKLPPNQESYTACILYIWERIRSFPGSSFISTGSNTGMYLCRL